MTLSSRPSLREPAMRKILTASAALVALTFLCAGAAQAQPPEVVVTLSPALAERAERTLGVREVEQQAVELVQTVRQELGRSGALQGSTIRLVLTDVKPNRPTRQQLTDRPGLSMHDSVSIGGAAIEGEIVTADGAVHPVKYDYFSPSIQWVIGGSTWQDASRAYDGFARRLSDGRL